MFITGGGVGVMEAVPVGGGTLRHVDLLLMREDNTTETT